MLTAEEVLAAVRVHADRVHDAVRRLGCDPQAAVEVVEQSAQDLVDAAASSPETVGDPVGWWFARARALARSVAGHDDDLPVGGGVLSADDNQTRLAQALESLPERDRAALLLRDSYDLPAAAVGTSLGLDAVGAMTVVGHARLAFLPALLGGTPLVMSTHAVDVGALARQSEGGQAAARDATTRRHVQNCDGCGDVVDAQERARRLLSGLTVVALPDAEREALLTRVESRARAVLPAAEPLVELEEWEQEPERRYSLSLMALGLVLAIGAGIGGGLLSSRGKGAEPLAAGGRAAAVVTGAPVLSLAPRPGSTGQPTPTTPTTPRVFLITPSPTPTPTPTATVAPATATPPSVTEPLSLEINPSSGPNDTEVTVNGRGWTPGAFVQLAYLERVGGNPGSSAAVQVDSLGRFTTTLTAHDSRGLPGPHSITAGDGTNSATATFNATG